MNGVGEDGARMMGALVRGLVGGGVCIDIAGAERG